MEKQKIDLVLKVVVVIGICVFGYFFIIGPYLNRGESDPRFVFIEVPFNETINSSVIHLQDKDIMNVSGLDIRLEKGKIAVIFFRYSETPPEISPQEFNQKYGSILGDRLSRKYLEYKGFYYYAFYEIP